MSLKSYQEEIDELLQSFEKPYWSKLSQFARLTEEVGEVGRALNNLYGDKVKKADDPEQDLGEELADVIFSVICLANSNDIDLDAAMTRVIEKTKTRDRDRYARKNDSAEEARA